MASAVADPAPQWGTPVVVAHVSLDGAAFWATQIAVADFNGDGHQDALIARDSRDAQHTFPVTVLLGDGRGKFSDGTSSVFQGDVPRIQYARQIVIADFNGDHRPDAFIADTGDDHSPFPGYQNTLILSAPGGKLEDATANLPQVNDYTHSAAAGDVNVDGATDLYIGNIYGANAMGPEILLNDGTGHFTLCRDCLPASVSNVFESQFTGSNFVDVNGDGHPDLVLSAGDITPRSEVLLNDGTGHFTELPGAMPAKPFGPDANGFDPTPIDINGDRYPDLVISYTKQNPFYVGRWIQVLINNGDGTFQDETGSRLPQRDNSDTWVEFFQPRDLGHNGRTGLGAQTNPLWGGPPLLYLLDRHGVFRPGPAVNGAFDTWAFIDASGQGSNDIVGVTASGDVLFIPELPTVSSLELTPSAFRAARSGASIGRAAAGAELSYRVSLPSITGFSVDRVISGSKQANRCVPYTPTVKRAQRCTRFVPVAGGFTHSDTVGANRFRFTGRLGGHALPPGSYRLDARPRNAIGGLGPAVHARFRIIH